MFSPLIMNSLQRQVNERIQNLPKCRLPECELKVISKKNEGYCPIHYANLLTWINKV